MASGRRLELAVLAHAVEAEHAVEVQSAATLELSHIHVGHAHTNRFRLMRGAPLGVLACGVPGALEGVGVDDARDGDRDPLLAWTVAVARLGAARPLSATVSRLVYAFGDRVDEDVLVDTLTRLWVNTLRLPTPPVEAHRKRTRKASKAGA
jgi:hypothetical protein